MPPTSIADLVAALPAEDSWGPSATSENMLNGVPYAPFSKGDKLGRMADWTAESKDRERQGRPQYNRNFRGEKQKLDFATFFFVPLAHRGRSTRNSD